VSAIRLFFVRGRRLLFDSWSGAAVQLVEQLTNGP
jgi:hypothetical protein